MDAAERLFRTPHRRTNVVTWRFRQHQAQLPRRSGDGFCTFDVTDEFFRTIVLVGSLMTGAGPASAPSFSARRRHTPRARAPRCASNPDPCSNARRASRADPRRVARRSVSVRIRCSAAARRAALRATTQDARHRDGSRHRLQTFCRGRESPAIRAKSLLRFPETTNTLRVPLPDVFGAAFPDRGGIKS